MKKVIVKAPIVENRLLGNDVYKMLLDAPEIASQSKPGQFVQVKTGRLVDPLLRRPISIGDVEDGKLALFYRVIGHGTAWLASCRNGDTIDLVGPLGNGFKLDAKKPLLVGGGIGIAPLVLLARQFCPMPVDILLAGRCKEEMFWLGQFAGSCQHTYITTDDGSMGTKGTALALLPELLASGNYDQVYSCGPGPMLRAVSKETLAKGVPCQLSLEKYMSCGLGACLSCACTATGGKRVKVCLNGPVFMAGEVAEI